MLVGGKLWHTEQEQWTGDMIPGILILKNMADEIAEMGLTMVYLPHPRIEDSLWENNGKVLLT